MLMVERNGRAPHDERAFECRRMHKYATVRKARGGAPIESYYGVPDREMGVDYRRGLTRAGLPLPKTARRA
jgi:hypothetical protein